MKAKAIVNKLLDNDADVDPEAYVAALRRKRDVVQKLIKNYAIRHTWQDSANCASRNRASVDRLLITFPKDVRFGIALHNHGVSPVSSICISGGSKNNRMLYIWNDGDLDSLINSESPGSLYLM